MRMNFKAELDPESKKSIVDVLLAEARTLARSEVGTVVRQEIARVAEAFTKQQSPYRLSKMFTEALRPLLVKSWGDARGASTALEAAVETVVRQNIKPAIDLLVAEAVAAEVKAKLARKTVWDAESQELYVRNIARQELRALLASAAVDS